MSAPDVASRPDARRSYRRYPRGTVPATLGSLTLLDGHDPVEVGSWLNAEGIAVRAGHHCAQPILRRLGVEATVRPSFAFYNTIEEAELLVSAVRRIAESGRG